MVSLPVNHPSKEKIVGGYSPSIGASPVASYLRVPFSGGIRRLSAVAYGAITTADCIVTVANNGATIGTITLPVASAAGGQIAHGQATTYAFTKATEDDVISFTPSGASGANIGCWFDVVLQEGA